MKRREAVAGSAPFNLTVYVYVTCTAIMSADVVGLTYTAAARGIGRVPSS